MTTKTWVGTAGGAWTADASWTPAGAPKTADDPAVIAGPSGTAQTITGPGSAVALTLTGNTALSGSFGFGSLTVGQGVTAGGLTVGAGATVTAQLASILNGSVLVSGLGAKLGVTGTLSFSVASGDGLSNKTLTVEKGGAVQAGSISLLPLSSFDGISVDVFSTVEVGSAGGAAAGRLTIDAGAAVTGAGVITAANGIGNSGTLEVAAGSYMGLFSPVTGTGTLQIDAKGDLSLRNVTSLNTGTVAFSGAGGTFDIGYYGGGANALPNFTGSISGFATGDTITVTRFGMPITAAAYTATGTNIGTLALSNGGTSLGSLTLAGNYAGATFQVGASGNTTSIIVSGVAPTPPPTPTPNPPAATTDVDSLVRTNLPPSAYSSAAIALATAGLVKLSGPGRTVGVGSLGKDGAGSPSASAANTAVAAGSAAGSSLTLPPGYNSLLASGGGGVTLSDAGRDGAVLVGNGAGDTFNSSGRGVTLVGGQGANTFNVSGSAAIVTGDGPCIVRGSGNAALTVATGVGGSTVVLAGGSSTVQSNGQDTVFAGTGASTVTAAKGLVAVGGDGRMSFAGGAATSLVFGAKGGVDYTAGSAYDIAVGGPGTLVAQGGAAGGQFWGNSGNDVLRATGGATTVLVANNGGQLYSEGAAGNFLIAGAGTAVLDGSKATGSDVFFGGTGTDTITAGSGNDLIGTGTGTSTVQLGSGKDTVFAFGASTVTAGSGSADIVMGGTVTLNIASGSARSFALFNFVPGTDKISLSGYGGGAVANALATQINGSGQTVLTLGDQTRIQLIGVTRADTNVFA